MSDYIPSHCWTDDAKWFVLPCFTGYAWQMEVGSRRGCLIARGLISHGLARSKIQGFSPIFPQPPNNRVYS